MKDNGLHLTRRIIFSIAAMMLFFSVSCNTEKKDRAPAIHANDTLPFMHSRGISTLISDSGIIRYKIIAEEWDMYNTTKPPRWTFMKGIFLERFDSTFHVEWFVEADTAYCYNQELWELRGRVTMRNQQGTVFTSEELFWDMERHEMYSTLFMTIRTPDRMLQGYNFRSNEQMTRYSVENSKGITPFKTSGNATPDSINTQEKTEQL